MADFVRVRSAVPGGPLHEVDVPLSWVERHPDRYEVIDSEPVATQRPASHFSGTVPVKSSARPKRAKSAKKQTTSPGEDSNAPSEGLTPEEN